MSCHLTRSELGTINCSATLPNLGVAALPSTTYRLSPCPLLGRYLEAQTMLEHWNYIAMKPLLASSLFGFGLHCGVHTGDLQAVGRWVWNRIVIIGEQSSGPLPFLTAPENDELKKKNKTLYSLASGKQTGDQNKITCIRLTARHMQSGSFIMFTICARCLH